MSKLFLTFLITVLFALPHSSALASTICQPVYGGGQNCITTGGISLNKRILHPSIPKALSPNDCNDTEFVENLGANDQKFGPTQTITFQLCITNTTGATIQQIAIKDTFPGFVNFVTGNGSFDSNTKTLTFTVDNLGPNETRPFIVQAKVSDAKDLPNGVTCVVNQATATANSGQMSQDNAQFCIEKAQVTTKGGLPLFPPPTVATTPSTGPELIPLISLLPGGLAGWFLRKKSSIKPGGEK